MTRIHRCSTVFCRVYKHKNVIQLSCWYQQCCPGLLNSSLASNCAKTFVNPKLRLHSAYRVHIELKFLSWNLLKSRGEQFCLLISQNPGMGFDLDVVGTLGLKGVEHLNVQCQKWRWGTIWYGCSCPMQDVLSLQRKSDWIPSRFEYHSMRSNRPCDALRIGEDVIRVIGQLYPCQSLIAVEMTGPKCQLEHVLLATQWNCSLLLKI